MHENPFEAPKPAPTPGVHIDTAAVLRAGTLSLFAAFVPWLFVALLAVTAQTMLMCACCVGYLVAGPWAYDAQYRAQLAIFDGRSIFDVQPRRVADAWPGGAALIAAALLASLPAQYGYSIADLLLGRWAIPLVVLLDVPMNVLGLGILLATYAWVDRDIPAFEAASEAGSLIASAFSALLPLGFVLALAHVPGQWLGSSGGIDWATLLQDSAKFEVPESGFGLKQAMAAVFNGVYAVWYYAVAAALYRATLGAPR